MCHASLGRLQQALLQNGPPLGTLHRTPLRRAATLSARRSLASPPAEHRPKKKLPKGAQTRTQGGPNTRDPTLVANLLCLRGHGNPAAVASINPTLHTVFRYFPLAGKPP
ncbi:hypothetical protein NDU88_005509 [Pleurodeles waltl]|uniref:Uncharacterized protein n=1 Tax=Pleurodeles waltl TaxID=8319 RepID=A0AAV7LPD4_PLEWA|nr:hypothetical protein NDU88_005509 [Pleurodeles waltl]